MFYYVVIYLICLFFIFVCVLGIRIVEKKFNIDCSSNDNYDLLNEELFSDEDVVIGFEEFSSEFNDIKVGFIRYIKVGM